MLPSGRVTIRDVALAAGVTMGTVSRALQRDPRVNAQTMGRVIQAADRLGYRPNHLASSLRRGRSAMLGWVCPGGAWILGHPMFAPLQAGFAAAAAGDGLAVVLYLPPGQDGLVHDPAAYPIHAIFDGRVDGVLIHQAEGLPPAALRGLGAPGPAAVLVNAGPEIPGFFQLLGGPPRDASPAPEDGFQAGREAYTLLREAMQRRVPRSIHWARLGELLTV